MEVTRIAPVLDKSKPSVGYRYSLDHGPRNKHICPACKRRSFVLYVDANGLPLNETVGWCDHLHSCGFHRSPRDYFREHPDLKGKFEDWRTSRPAWLDKEPENTAPCLFPQEIVRATQKYSTDCNLRIFLNEKIDPVVVEGCFVEYGIGVTRDGGTIFWQFDIDGNCRGGKIIHYGSNGHRIKSDSTPPVNWAHALMKDSLPPGWTLSQWLFGENLLAKYPNKPVGLVEAEKTAVVCAALMPGYVWLATGGRAVNLGRAEAILKSRFVIAIPDMDAHEEWGRKFANCRNMTVSDVLFRLLPAELHGGTFDLADVLLTDTKLLKI